MVVRGYSCALTAATLATAMRSETQMHHFHAGDFDCAVRPGVSARLAGVVAEDEPAAPLAGRIHHPSFGRGRELLEHLGVDALVLRPELRIAQTRLEHAPVEVFTIRFHASREYRGNEDKACRSLDVIVRGQPGTSHRDDASVSRRLSRPPGLSACGGR